jgi:hypothetical protein
MSYPLRVSGRCEFESRSKLYFIIILLPNSLYYFGHGHVSLCDNSRLSYLCFD